MALCGRGCWLDWITGSGGVLFDRSINPYKNEITEIDTVEL